MRRLLFIPLLFLLAPMLAPGDVTIPQCTASFHAKFSAVGPNSARYPTWHPQMAYDRYSTPPSYCYFGHEHGSNPALFGQASLNGNNNQTGYWPVYGYAAGKMMMSEGESGFKSYVFNDLQGHIWLISQHFGTGNAHLAACVRMHTLDIAIKDATTGELLVDMHTMGDYGMSRSSHNNAPLIPDTCPTQNTIVSGGVRNIPVVVDQNPGYEPWRVDSTVNLIGFSPHQLTINTLNRQTSCDYITCTASIQNPGDLGTLRVISFSNGFGFTQTGVYSNTFYTDPTGKFPRIVTDTDAVRQYIKPGLSFGIPFTGYCQPHDAFAELYWCTTATPDDQEKFRRNPFITGAN